MHPHKRSNSAHEIKVDSSRKPNAYTGNREISSQAPFHHRQPSPIHIYIQYNMYIYIYIFSIIIMLRRVVNYFSNIADSATVDSPFQFMLDIERGIESIDLIASMLACILKQIL